jgi:MFS family permease
VIGLLVAATGLAGSLAGGMISDRWLRNGVPAARLRVMATAWCVILPGAIMWPLVGDPIVSYAIFAVTMTATAMAQAAAPSIVQDIAPNRMRGQAVALYLLVGGLLGIGFGPTAAALLTVHVFHRESALGLSLAVVAGPVALLGTLSAWLGLQPYARTVAALARESAEEESVIATNAAASAVSLL